MPNPTHFYMVIGHHMMFVDESPFEKPKPVVFGTYEADSHINAFTQFLEEFAFNDVRKAQVFYNDVVVVKVGQGKTYPMSKTFGELAKFPNVDMFQDGFDWRW